MIDMYGMEWSKPTQATQFHTEMLCIKYFHLNEAIKKINL